MWWKLRKICVLIVLLLITATLAILYRASPSETPGKSPLQRNIHNTWRANLMDINSEGYKQNINEWRKSYLAGLKNQLPTIATSINGNYPTKNKRMNKFTSHYHNLKNQSGLIHLKLHANDIKRKENLKHNLRNFHTLPPKAQRFKVHPLQSRAQIVRSKYPERSSARGFSFLGNEKTYENLKKKFPTVMIIGFGKAGTKTLLEVLKTRPDIIGPDFETRHFSRKYAEGLLGYLQKFPYPSRHELVIEKSPDYIIDDRVPLRIAKTVHALNVNQSDMKFIVVLRDPIDRAVSEYLEWEVARTYLGLDLDPFPVMTLTKDGKINGTRPFINGSNYTPHITRWLQYFKNSKTCFVDGDRFARDPFPEVNLLEKCLGLETYFKPSDFVYNSLTGFYCFRKELSRMCMNKSKGRKHPTLPPLLLSKLKAHFRPMANELFHRINRKLLWPNFQN